MTTELKTKLLDALKLAKPDLDKPYYYNRCVTKYLSAILSAISQAISFNYKSAQLQADEFLFSQSKIREKIGTIGKPQQYIYHLMREHETTSLIQVIRTGFSKNGVSKLSTGRINPLYKELVMEKLLSLRMEANLKLLDEIEANANYTVNVDPVSLRSFIAKTAETIGSTGNSDAYKEKLLRNLMAARQLQTMIHPADETNATPYIRERWELADSGRIYGQGYSLQRMPKEVRHAALGVCHKYDFKACAFAIMAGLAHEIDPSIRIGAILDYIKNRQVIRSRIAGELTIGESLVKTIFTAIGFGAELKNNQHNAIRGALAAAARKQHDTTVRLERHIYNNLGAAEFNKLVENRTFGYIYAELQTVNQTIIDHFKSNALAIGQVAYSDIDPKTGKKRSDRQKLAWIYQALESMALQRFCELAMQEPLLTTHDCVYFKQKLPASVVVDATYLLRQTFSYLRFEHEAIYPIADAAQFNARFDDADRFEHEHNERIAADEKLAQLYYKPNAYSALPRPKTSHSTLIVAS